MKRLIPTLLLAIIAAAGFSQAGSSNTDSKIQTVSVASKGQDVRSVLADMFGQVKKNFVIEPNTHFALFLSLNDMEFEEALNLVLKTASLKYQLQNGIYFISKDKSPAVGQSVVTSEKTSGKLAPTVLRKLITVKFHKVSIRTLFADLTSQTGVMIEVDPKVPDYKVDVVLRGTTLKLALQKICRPAGLTYKYTDNLSLMIVPAPAPTADAVKIEAAS